MSILNIVFAFISSVLYFWIFSKVKELSATNDWAINVGVPCLIAATLLFNYIKDKISEKDPSSKLYKVSAELKALETSHENVIKSLKKQNEELLKTSISTYTKQITELKSEVAHLTKKLGVKDTIIHGIKNSITSSLIKHGSTEPFYKYAKDLAENINSDLDLNTLSPVTTPETMKYIDLFKKLE